MTEKYPLKNRIQNRGEGRTVISTTSDVDGRPAPVLNLYNNHSECHTADKKTHLHRKTCYYGIF